MKSFIFLLTVFCLTTTAACSGEKYGAGIDSNAPKVSVKDVHLNKNLKDQLINLEGTIISQCQSPDKCWFFMEDQTGRIFVNLKPAQFTIPGGMGKKVQVTGKIQPMNNEFQIMAQGVKIF